MAKIQKKVPSKYSSQQLYDLVSDVANYPQFVPACICGEVLAELPAESAVKAKLSFEKSGVTQSFTTKNTLTPGKSIQMDLVDGPFKSLHGFWTFETTADGCLVGVELDFEFSSMMYKMMFSSVFQKVITDLLNAFVVRAEELYG
jgi:ribosome-associated toxin RatA of RatAB toxin-antitoxin module